MRLEKQEQEQLAERKGLAGRTILQVIWLLISFGIAYFVVDVLESEGYFSYRQIYEALSVPGTVPQWVIQGVLMLMIVVVMQFIMFLAFAWVNPEGRRRPGTPTLHSHRKDPFDDGY